jgi:hypothetical protein
VIQFVNDLRHVGGCVRDTPVSCTNKTDRHDITEISLKVALNTINQAKHLCPKGDLLILVLQHIETVEMKLTSTRIIYIAYYV